MDSISLSIIAAQQAPIAEETFTPVDDENVLLEDVLPQEQVAPAAIVGDEMEMEEEIEEELIIEDFTIDGICGVY